MTNEEIIRMVRETWNNYCHIDNCNLTTTGHKQIDDLLDDVERLVRDHAQIFLLDIRSPERN